jgi:hypothetical protein
VCLIPALVETVTVDSRIVVISRSGLVLVVVRRRSRLGGLVLVQGRGVFHALMHIIWRFRAEQGSLGTEFYRCTWVL